MGGGGSTSATQNQSQVQTRSPWAPATPALTTALDGAMDAYKSTYTGPNVATMDPNVTAGQDAILANSAGGGLTQAAQAGISGLGRTFGAGGLSGEQQQGAAGVSAGLANLGRAAENLSPYASGQFLKAGQNPYLDSTIQSAMSDAANGVNAQFTSAGRYGSGAQADALGSRLGSIAANARMQDYTQQQQNQLAANGQLSGIGQAQGGVASALAGIGQQGVSNLLNAGGALGSLGTAQNADAANRIGIGGQRMDYRQQQIDDANQSPWARVGNLAQIATGMGNMGGTSTGFSTGTTTQQQPGGGLGSILGAGATGIGGLANIAKTGGFAALFSDARLKEDIRPVGRLDDGQKIYAYRYKDGGPVQIGLLAQEVAQHKPGAVARHDSGFLMVDYGKATGAE